MSRANPRAVAVFTIAESAKAQVERLCSRWGAGRSRGGRAFAVIEGAALAVEGFAEITSTYRREIRR